MLQKTRNPGTHVIDCLLAREQVAGGAAAAGDDAAVPRAEADVARPR